MGNHEEHERIALMADAVRKALRGELPSRLETTGNDDALDGLASAINELLSLSGRSPGNLPSLKNRSADSFVTGTFGLTDDMGANESLRKSEALYRLLAENASDIIFTMDTGLRFSYISPSVTRLRGWTVEEAMAQSPAEALTPDSMELAARTFQQALLMEASGELGLDKPISLELEETCKDGSTIWTETTFSPIRSPEGRFIGFLGITRDIAERKKAEELLKASEARYRSIFENTGGATVIYGEDTIIRLANSNFEKLCGYAREEIEGRMSWTGFIDKEDLERIRHYHGMRVKSPSSVPSTYEFRFIDRQGNVKDIFHTVSVIRGTTDRVATLIDITPLRQAQEALRESEKRYREILEQIEDGYYEVDLKGSVTFFNNAVCRILGYSPEELMGRNYLRYMAGENDDRLFRTFNGVFLTGRPARVSDWKFIRKDGATRFVESSISLMKDENGTPYGFRGIARDVTEQRNLQERLTQAQKMESVGQLAGGIAHDFNNMLTPILGYAELLGLSLSRSDKAFTHVEGIIRSAERSRDLVRQLLAFARKQTLEMKPLDLNLVITSIEKMLKRTLHENVAIRTHLSQGLGVILGDTSQIEQIILNLSVNAQDAMPEGGTLSISTEEVLLDEDSAKVNEGATPGRYVVMEVSDTGVGMDTYMMGRLFEPFFTTKGPGKGTGLGLATVYGIVKQHGGNITVNSDPGGGTTFRVYLPWHRIAAESANGPEEQSRDLRGNETLLVVEDEDLVREMVAHALKSYGYEILEAADAGSALELSASHQGRIHLMVSDVVLSDVNGKALYQKLAPSRPDMKVLYMSGYTAEVITHHNILEQGVHFIQKPFSIQGLAAKVRGVLDGPGSG